MVNKERKPAGKYPNLFAALSEFVEATKRNDEIVFGKKDNELQEKAMVEWHEAIDAAKAMGATEFDIYHAWMEGTSPERRQGLFYIFTEEPSLPYVELQVLQDLYGLKQ
jgi:hypothetical protein